MPAAAFGDDSDERNPQSYQPAADPVPDLSGGKFLLAIEDEGDFPFGAEYLEQQLPPRSTSASPPRRPDLYTIAARASSCGASKLLQQLRQGAAAGLPWPRQQPLLGLPLTALDSRRLLGESSNCHCTGSSTQRRYAFSKLPWRQLLGLRSGTALLTWGPALFGACATALAGKCGFHLR